MDNSNDAFSMFTCASNAFTGKNIKSNPGFYIITTCVVIQSIFFVSLIFKPTIGSFAKLLILANPPKKPNENSKRRTVQKITDKDYFLTKEEENKLGVKIVHMEVTFDGNVYFKELVKKF